MTLTQLSKFDDIINSFFIAKLLKNAIFGYFSRNDAPRGFEKGLMFSKNDASSRFFSTQFFDVMLDIT